jgi:hypothetical protein
MFQVVNHLVGSDKGKCVRGEVNVEYFVVLHDAHVGL